MSERFRPLALNVALLACLGMLAVPAALARPALTLPNPCTALPAASISAAFPTKTTLTGSLKTQTANGQTYKVCT
jgi:hypothetical protein